MGRQSFELPQEAIWVPDASGTQIAISEPTLRRALQSIDILEVDRAISGWLKRILNVRTADGIPVLSVDGKTVRASKAEGGQKTLLLSAFLQNRGIVVAQKNVDEKTNEIPHLRTLLAPMDIEGQIVTADALHTQTKTARFITEGKKADYVFTVKKTSPPCSRTFSTLDRGHGRIERRTLTVSSELKEHFPEFSFPGHR